MGRWAVSECVAARNSPHSHASALSLKHTWRAGIKLTPQSHLAPAHAELRQSAAYPFVALRVGGGSSVPQPGALARLLAQGLDDLLAEYPGAHELWRVVCKFVRRAGTWRHGRWRQPCGVGDGQWWLLGSGFCFGAYSARGSRGLCRGARGVRRVRIECGRSCAAPQRSPGQQRGGRGRALSLVVTRWECSDQG